MPAAPPAESAKVEAAPPASPSSPAPTRTQSPANAPVPLTRDTDADPALRIAAEILAGEFMGLLGVGLGGLIGYALCGPDTPNCLPHALVGGIAVGSVGMSLGVYLVGSTERDGNLFATWGGAAAGLLFGSLGASAVTDTNDCGGDGDGCDGGSNIAGPLVVFLTVPIAVTVLVFEVSSTDRPNGPTLTLLPSPGGLRLRSQF